MNSSRSASRVVAPDHPKWNKDSKVPQLVFHATNKVFDRFDTSKGDLGAHFGNLTQASRISQQRCGGFEQGARIITAQLNITNPLRFKDVGSFHSDGISLQLEKIGLLPKGDGKRIHLACDQNWRLRKEYDPVLRKIIIEAGYDGVVYANTQEGPGDSFIALEAEQIRIIRIDLAQAEPLGEEPDSPGFEKYRG